MYYNTDGTLAGISMYPRGVTWPGGTWPPQWSPGDTGYGQPYGFTSPNPYTDPFLGDPGFFDTLGKIVSAPVRVAAKGVTTVVKVGGKVIRQVPKMAVGLAAGGIPGAIAAGGAGLIAEFARKSPQEQEQIRQQLMHLQLEDVDPYAGTSTPGSIQDMLDRTYQGVRREALRRGGEYIAGQPEAQQAIRERTMERMGEYIKPVLLPALLVGGALLLARK